MKRWGWGQRLLDEKNEPPIQKVLGRYKLQSAAKMKDNHQICGPQNPLTENLIRQSWQLKTNQDYIHIGTCMDVAQTKNVYHFKFDMLWG